jgi:myo-inositol-1(or 4)-monophosphatase
MPCLLPVSPMTAEKIREFLMQAQEIRRLGSAALDLCYVACGRFDGYWEAQLNPWDKAAGMLILKEAGGKLSDYSGKPLTLTEPTIVASNGLLQGSILAVLKTSIALQD